MQRPLQVDGYDPCMDTGDILHVLDEADLNTKMRGYDPFEVDELLDRAAQEIKSLRSDLKSASDRADLAEERLEAELVPASEARTEAESTLAAAEQTRAGSAERPRPRQSASDTLPRQNSGRRSTMGAGS